MPMRLILVAAAVALLTPATAAAQRPLGIVGPELAYYDRDSLTAAGPRVAVAEPHTRPVLNGGTFALGLSESATRGRVGLWIGDAQTLSVTHRVATGIAAEDVVFPGVVAALLQDGQLLVVNPDTGAIVRRQHVGRTHCAPAGVHVAGRGVMVNAVRRNGVAVVIVDRAGRVRRTTIRLTTPARRCRKVALVADGRHAYIVGPRQVAILDPATGSVRTRRLNAPASSAAIVPGGLVVAGPDGARRYDTARWRAGWRDARARTVLAEGATVIASGGGEIRALDARTGRRRWRASGEAAAVAAGRVYARPAVLDLETGERRGTHPETYGALRFADEPAARPRARAGQATWPFTHVGDVTEQSEVDVSDGVVYTALRRTLTIRPIGGAARTITLPRGTQNVDIVRATGKALMVFLAGPNWRVVFGPPDGPLKRHRRAYTTTAAVTGSTLLTVERDRRWIYARDVGGGPQRRVVRPGKDLAAMVAAGDYAAVLTDFVSRRERLAVVNVRTGRVVYRVPSRSYTYRLSDTGRVVLIDDEFERIRTATPADPRLRTIARVRAISLAVAGENTIFQERLSDSTGRLVLLTPDGRQRALTQRMPLVGKLAYDGETLVFAAGKCLFAGPVPSAEPAAGPPPDATRSRSRRTRSGRRSRSPARAGRSGARSTPRRPCAW